MAPHFSSLYQAPVLNGDPFQRRLRRGVECAAGKGRPGWRAAEGDAGAGATLGALPPEAREVHGRFMRLVFELIDGSLDPGQYEDAVRALLGAPPRRAPPAPAAVGCALRLGFRMSWAPSGMLGLGYRRAPGAVRLQCSAVQQCRRASRKPSGCGVGGGGGGRLGGLHRACIAAAQRRWQLLLLCHAAA